MPFPPTNSAPDREPGKVSAFAATKCVAMFILVIIGLYNLYFLIPDEYLADVLYHNIVLTPIVKLINVAVPSESAYSFANGLYSPHVNFQVVRGCDGTGLLFLLLAAICATPVSLRTKLNGCLLAILFTYVLNEIRLLALFFVQSHSPELFEQVHTYFIPTLLVALGCLFFAIWTTRVLHEPASFR